MRKNGQQVARSRKDGSIGLAYEGAQVKGEAVVQEEDGVASGQGRGDVDLGRL